MKYIPGQSGVVVITGGAAGIGKALAINLRDRGMTVAIADIDNDRVQKAALELGVAGFQVDVREVGSVKALHDALLDRFGSVHVVCNNAGVGQYRGFIEMPYDDWRWIFDVNFWGIVNGIKEFLPTLLKNPDGGYIINTLSMRGFSGFPGAGAYVASKFAGIGATECLAAELRASNSPVGCTAFCPGPVESEIAESYSRHKARTAGVVPADTPPSGGGSVAVRRMPASQAADVAIDAYLSGRFWAITHPELMQDYINRHEILMAAVR